MQLFIVMAGYDYDGLCGQWVFMDEASARAKFDVYAAGLRAEDKAFEGDYVVLKGPFAPGEDVHDLGERKRELAACDPGHERREAAYQASLAKRREARRAAKAAAAAV